jgi:hypothetical protein
MLILCVAYVVGVFAGTALAGPEWTPWFLGAWSIAFTGAFVVFARGQAGVALAIVLLLTVLLPLGALFIVGWPARESVPGLIVSIWAAFEERGWHRAVEFLGPVVASAIAALVVRRPKPSVQA